jgi:hypothetical protein
MVKFISRKYNLAKVAISMIWNREVWVRNIQYQLTTWESCKICLMIEENHGNLYRYGRSQRLPNTYWLVAISPANKIMQISLTNVFHTLLVIIWMTRRKHGSALLITINWVPSVRQSIRPLAWSPAQGVACTCCLLAGSSGMFRDYNQRTCQTIQDNYELTSMGALLSQGPSDYSFRLLSVFEDWNLRRT